MLFVSMAETKPAPFHLLSECVKYYTMEALVQQCHVLQCKMTENFEILSSLVQNIRKILRICRNLSMLKTR